MLELMVRRHKGRSPGDDRPRSGPASRSCAWTWSAASPTGVLVEHDSELMAAAIVGAAVEVAIRLLNREPLDVEGPVELGGRACSRQASAPHVVVRR